MTSKSEIALTAVVVIIAALFVANLTILFKIHDDQQIIKEKIEKLLFKSWNG